MAERIVAAGFKTLLAGAVWLGAVLALPVSAQAISTIRIAPSKPDAASVFPGWVRQAPFSETVRIELELGDDPYNAVLAMDSEGKQGDQRVLVQFETSLAIGGEGPHIDLLDWKHCVSEWQALQSTLTGEFVLPGPTVKQATCFPRATKAELREALVSALEKDGGDELRTTRWLALTDSIKVPGDSPSYVGVSKMRVRIEQLIGQEWKKVTTLEFILPLGC